MTTTTPPPSTGQSTRDQLTAITNRLAEAQKEVTKPPSPAPTAPAPSDVKETQGVIKQLEATLATIPESEGELRATIEARIKAKKDELTAGKPVGARLDQARAALQRAQGRQQDAQAAIEAAMALKAVADAEVAQHAAEVHELEASFATAPCVEADAPLQHMQKLMCGMIEGLKQDPFVDPSHVESATQHCKQLIDGFTTTLAEAAKHKQRTADAEMGAPSTRRAGKQPLGPDVTTVLLRANGKQPPRTKPLTDHFQVGVKKVVSKFGKAPVARQGGLCE